ncbi:MAG: hypothetical protein ACT4OS_06600 [Acidimicrobiales bacterium]
MDPGVVSCDNLVTVPLAEFDRLPVGRLGLEPRIRLDRVLRYALDIAY